MIEKNIKNCSGCRVCEKICPNQAIEMRKDFKGFLYPYVNNNKCIKCGLCKKRCPIDNQQTEKNKIAYAAYNKDENIRKNSSSGGVFSAIAEFVIEKNGIVFGVAFDDEFLVEHICVDNKEDLKKLRGSKYIQSDVKDSFEKVKEFLDKGRLVYFSGTPCQIEGLKAYLNKEYNNLITQDIICHGVPSPRVWQEYLKYKKEEIKECNFRCKEKSTWGDYQLKFVYDDKIEYIDHNEDIFMKLFLNNSILRESCYHCRFKSKNTVSDLTLADFWGIKKVEPSFFDERGISLIIVNSEKGKKILEYISDNIEKKEVDFEEAISHNLSMIESAPRGKDFWIVSELIQKQKFNEIFEVEKFKK